MIWWQWGSYDDRISVKDALFHMFSWFFIRVIKIEDDWYLLFLILKIFSLIILLGMFNKQII